MQEKDFNTKNEYINNLVSLKNAISISIETLIGDEDFVVEKRNKLKNKVQLIEIEIRALKYELYNAQLTKEQNEKFENTLGYFAARCRKTIRLNPVAYTYLQNTDKLQPNLVTKMQRDAFDKLGIAYELVSKAPNGEIAKEVHIVDEESREWKLYCMWYFCRNYDV